MKGDFIMDAHILAVDDNPEIREIIGILLTGEGFAVDQAGDGTQALAMLKEKHYDLIILDIMMPGMNGYQTCLEIRKLTNAPILFLSARTKDSDKTLGFSSGGDDYLAKPFSYPELISRVKALIRYIKERMKRQLPKSLPISITTIWILTGIPRPFTGMVKQ